MITWVGIKDWLLMKAVNLHKNRQGLVQVLRTITVKGTTFTRPYWIKPDEVRSNDKVIGGFQNLPQGHVQKPQKISPTAKVPQEIRDIVNAYQDNYLQTHSDKTKAVEAFLNGLKAYGISWKEHPLAHVNMMRAKMAINMEVMAGWRPPGVDPTLFDKAQQYITQHSTTPQPHIVNTSPATVAPTTPIAATTSATPPMTSTAPAPNPIQLPTVPKGYVVSQESKDKVKAFHATFANDQDFFNVLENAGITWGKSAKPGPNLMQAKMALTKLVEAGLDLNTLVAPPAPDITTPPTPPPDIANPTDVIVNDTPIQPAAPKDESLLEVPDDATASQKEIIKYINQMDDPTAIKQCALLGIVPEDDYTRDYIIQEPLKKLLEWIEDKNCPEAVVASVIHDVQQLGLDSVKSKRLRSSYGKLWTDIEKAIAVDDILQDNLWHLVASKIHNETLSINTLLNPHKVIDQPDYFFGSLRNSYRVTGIDMLLRNTHFNFANYVIPDDDPDSIRHNTNVGYNDWDPQKYSQRYDREKEGFVRLLRKLQHDNPSDTDLQNTTENMISQWDNLMRMVNYNHRLLFAVLSKGQSLKDTPTHPSTWDTVSNKDYNKYGSAFYNYTSEGAQTVLERIDLQTQSVIKTLEDKGYSQTEILDALSDVATNDGTLVNFTIKKADTGETQWVDIEDVTTGHTLDSDARYWNAQSLFHTLVAYQRRIGMDVHSPEAQEYHNRFNIPGFKTSVVSDVDYDDGYYRQLQQTRDFTRQQALDVFQAAADLLGFDSESWTAKADLSDSHRAVVSNLVAAEIQNQINKFTSESLTSVSRQKSATELFDYYPSSAFTFNTRNRPRLKHPADKATYTAQELSDVIDKQLANTATYSPTYLNNMRGYYARKANNTGIDIDEMIQKDKLTNTSAISQVMNSGNKDLLYNTLCNVLSHVPSVAKDPSFKKELAAKLNYMPFDPSRDRQPRPKKSKAEIEATKTKDLKQARQMLFNRAAGTLGTVDDETNQHMMDDFLERWDYKPGDKTPDGRVISQPLHTHADNAQGSDGIRIPIFNTKFFILKNDDVWTDRFQEAKQKMKDDGVDPSCYEELPVFHGCPKASVLNILGRSKGWFMDADTTHAGQALGPGGYFGNVAGKSCVYAGDNAYSCLHRVWNGHNDLDKDSADGIFIQANVMRGSNYNKDGKRDKKYTSSSLDAGRKLGSWRTLRDWEICIRDNALINPTCFVDVSTRCLGWNIFRDDNGNYTNPAGEVVATHDFVSVNMR